MNIGMDLNKALELAYNAQKVSREILLQYFGKLKNIEKKHLAGLVSEADRESEIAIIKELSSFAVKVVGEESSYNADESVLFKKGETRWLIDPLDGTTNYVHGFPIFCISIALQVEGEVVLALIDAPILNKTYTAIKGQGAFCNQKKMSVSKTKKLNDSLAATGFFAENEQALKRQLSVFCQMVKQCRGIRRAGAAAYDLCMVAEGVFDIFWEENLKPWDTAAGLLLVREAGGLAMDYNNNIAYPESKNLIASNGIVHDEAIQYFS